VFSEFIRPTDKLSKVEIVILGSFILGFSYPLDKDWYLLGPKQYKSIFWLKLHFGLVGLAQCQDIP
jgi:hypothetical protein